MQKMRKINKNTKIHREIVNQILKLATSSFGLVSALAWNEVIKEVVEQYIKPLVGGNSGVISLLIYALLVTSLAVTVTINLSKISKRD
jgi:hypothetical protein